MITWRWWGKVDYWECVHSLTWWEVLGMPRGFTPDRPSVRVCWSTIWEDIHIIRQIILLKRTTTLFALSDHYILSREWRIIVDQVQTNNHGRHMILLSVRCDRAVDYEGSPLSVLMVGCVLSQLKPEELYILSCEKSLGVILYLKPICLYKVDYFFNTLVTTWIQLISPPLTFPAQIMAVFSGDCKR